MKTIIVDLDGTLADVKSEILRAHFEKQNVLFVVDDRQAAVDMWREGGLVCLQCYPART